MISEFKMYRQDNGNLPYDFHSIMHYSNKYFSKNGQNTMEALIDPEMRLGQSEGFSALDVVRINMLYRCPELRENCKYAIRSPLPGSCTQSNDSLFKTNKWLPYCFPNGILSPGSSFTVARKLRIAGSVNTKLVAVAWKRQVVSFCQKSVLMYMYSVFQAVFPSCLSWAALSVLKET